MAEYLDVVEDYLWTVKSRDALGCLLQMFVDGGLWSEQETFESLEDVDGRIDALLSLSEEPVVLVAATESDQGDMSFHMRVASMSEIQVWVESGLWKDFSNASPAGADQLH